MVFGSWYGGALVKPQSAFCLLLISFLAMSRTAAAEAQVQGELAQSQPPDQVVIDYEEETRPSPQDTYFAAPVEQIFKNPAIVNGLQSGADAINKSIESLMDALFYSLLDNEFNYYLSKDKRYWLSAAFKRDVFSAPNGAYVVVDRSEFGPRYSQELWREHNIPITLGIDGSVEMLQIHLRTDGMRLAEMRDLPTWRRWINNWFGLLPVLTAILPPSFNQNELYDPLRQLYTPFSFPLKTSGFYEMPVGSIRSYALSGGVRLPIELVGALPRDMLERFQQAGNLNASLPYTIFKRGEHRINVLRRSEHIAWVGIKDLNRTGHLLAPLVGEKLEIFQGALAASFRDMAWTWSGVPIGLYPIGLEFEKALAKLYDQVYEYDLRKPLAREAYEKAVQGDFSVSRLRHLDRVEKKQDTGVVFQFTRVQERNESNLRNAPNLAFFRTESRRDHHAAEVEITDAEGKFYVLETQQDSSDKNWDILVGEEDARIRGLVELKVHKVVDKNEPDNPEAYTFSFGADPDPMSLTFTMAIQDRYTDVVEMREYFEQLRFFTKMPLDEVPDLPLRDQERLESAWRKGYFTPPGKSIRRLHVTPQQLGGFGAQALISINSAQIDKILSASEDEMWAAYAGAFGVDPAPFRDGETRQGLLHQMRWFQSFFLYPVRLFNIRLPWADVIKEADGAVKALLDIKNTPDPVKRLDGFYRMLETDHPLHATRAILNLADIAALPRRVTITAQPKGSASAATKAKFGRLNNKIFKAGPTVPPPGRYQVAQQKMAAFYLDQPREASDKPHLAKIQVSTRPLPSALRAITVNDELMPIPESQRRRKHVFVNFQARNVALDKNLKLYVRVEQGGKLRLGKLHLAEQVIDLPTFNIIASPDGERLGAYQFFLTGPLSPLSNFIFNEMTESGDRLLVIMAVSSDGNVWSPERQVEFIYGGGKLMKPE